MKKTWMIWLSAFVFSACAQEETQNQNTETPIEPTVVQGSLTGQKIQVALLLDTSGSMDGLIDQAKMRLWNVVNTLTTLTFNGIEPDVEIALYEYGNDRISAKEDWVRLIVPLTKDLDEISEKLFALRTNGGTEYCGSVIQHATNNLQWSDHENSLKLIYIAGNEPFNQHGVNYKTAVSGAVQNEIFVNTIYCGNYEAGVRELWRDGASLGNGKYFNIDSNREIQFVQTPYDDSIAYYNVQLNQTYISFSAAGSSYKEKQMQQDNDNYSMSEGAYIERSISKSKSNAYDNSHWDLVDKYKKDPKSLKSIKQEELPKELQGKSSEELEAHAKKLMAEREKHQKAIQQLSVQRQKFIDSATKSQGKEGDDLGQAIEKSVMELGKLKGYAVVKEM